MKQVKIAYEKCVKRMPHRPPDEIDFGLGFRAALEWIGKMIDNDYDIPAEGRYVGNHIEDAISEELQ